MIEKPISIVPLDNIDEIVADITTKLSAEDKVYIANGTLREARSLHHSLGQWIRNTYSLWHLSPLTLRWRSQPETHDIRDGVDYSQDHPDQVSDKIIEALWYKLQDC